MTTPPPQHGPHVRQKIRIEDADGQAVLIAIGGTVHRLNAVEAAHLSGLLDGWERTRYMR